MAPPGQRGRGEILRLAGDKVETNFLPGTETSIELHGLLSFASVSIRGNDVCRVRPEHGAGHCRHSPGQKDSRFNASKSVVTFVDSDERP